MEELISQKGMVTQKQIAERLGVSVSLISRALSGTATDIGVPMETVERIRNTAAAMGYTPNWPARMLKGAPARTFGVVVYDFEDPFFAPLIGVLQRLARKRQFSLVLSGFENRDARGADVSALFHHPINGLIVIGSGQDLEWLEPFVDQDIPLARIGNGPPIDGLRSFQLDEAAGMPLLLDHLASLGHDHIVFVGRDQVIHKQRGAYFLQAARERGLTVSRSDCVYSRARLPNAGYEAVQTLFARRKSHLAPTALVASSDLVALGALRALSEMNIRVPQDLSLTGHDDIPMARLSLPALTTLRQPVDKMAKQAFEWITGVQEPDGPMTTFSPELIVRESTRALNVVTRSDS